MTSETEPVESKASRLLDELTDFATTDLQSDRERMLPNILESIKEKFDRYVRDYLVEREPQEKLTEASYRASQTKFEVERQIVRPWVGDYTVVLVDSHGKVAAAVQESYELRSDRLQHALTKAVVSLHLQKSMMFGGLGNIENLKYLQKLGLQIAGTKGDIYMGSSREPVTINGRAFYIGTAGCEFNPNYLGKILGGALPNKEDTQAGLFDNEFAQRVALHLANPKHGAQTIEEPREFLKLRWQN